VESVNGRESDSERLVNNFLNFRVENFKVQEEGTLQDIITHGQQSFDIQNTDNTTEEFGFLSTNA
jgi:hypothetical protein